MGVDWNDENVSVEDVSSMLGVGSGPVTTKEGLDSESSLEDFDSKSSAGSAFGAVKGSGSGMEGSSLSGSSISSSSTFFLDFFSFFAFLGLAFGLSSLTSGGSADGDDPEPRISSIEMPLEATAAPGLLSPQPSQNLRKSSFIAPHEGHFHMFSVSADDIAGDSIEGSISSEEDFECRSFMGEIGA